MNGKPRGSKPSEPEASNKQTTTPYGWTQSRWGWRRWEGETPLDLLQAYDLIYDSPAFGKLSAERGIDVRKQIEDQLFRNAAAYLIEFPFWYHIHNNAGMQVAEIVRTGMVLNEPSYAAFGHRWGKAVLEQYAFSRDAAFGESPGYFYVFLATQADNFEALKEAAAYFGGGTAPAMPRPRRRRRRSTFSIARKRRSRACGFPTARRCRSATIATMSSPIRPRDPACAARFARRRPT